MPPAVRGASVCLSCRLKLLARAYTCNSTLRPLPPFINRPSFAPLLPSTAHSRSPHIRQLHSERSLTEQHAGSTHDGAEVAPTDEDVDWTPHFMRRDGVDELNDKNVSDVNDESQNENVPAEDEGELLLPRGTPEEMARAARQTFRDRLPEGVLNEVEYKMYERLYGTPLPDLPAEVQVEVEDAGEEAREVLFREGRDGELEEVDYLADGETLLEAEADELISEEDEVGEAEIYHGKSKANTRLEDDIQTAIGAASSALTIKSPDEVMVREEEDVDSEDADSEGESRDIRTHPFTLAGRFGTNPSTIPLPQDGLVGPTSLLLADIPNKHLDESAARVFGGSALPYGTGTPISSRILPQKPIPLSASQSRMTEMEADLYMSAIMPGTYAAVMSVLVETRKRLGSEWIERLMNKEGGPKVLDAGAGGAGVLAWREVVKAEWSRLNPSAEAPEAAENTSMKPPPYGKATVLTASAPLRQRASILLDNTTFIPRLPDYVHTHFDADAERKRFDIIIAPHSLWHLQEDFERRQRVLNLWSLLDPAGGILILLEKGIPRGFEVIADARGYLLGELFEGSTLLDEEPSRAEPESSAANEVEDASTSQGQEPTKAKSLRASRRAPGRIVGPCTNHSKCPMYLVPGISRQRKDYCHFSQRYVRPTYLQRMLGAKDRNHEDVRFSYIAVQKGIAFDDESGVARGVFKGDRATERAFMGYEVGDEDIFPSSSSNPTTPTSTSTPSHFANPPPRLILPPLKRHGHILLDVCTPSGTLERWTVTKSTSRQAYRDARKSKWGDLWMLGAKFRAPKRVRLGWGHMEQGIGTGRGEKGIREAVEAGLGKEGKGKGKGKAGAGKWNNGPIKDVAGRTRQGGEEESTRGGGGAREGGGGRDGGGINGHREGKRHQSKGAEQRGIKRREEKERGRLKARSRRRSETKELFGSRTAGGDRGFGGEE